jgi:hypothetical protein
VAEEPKRLDVDAIIEAKRQRMAAKGSASLQAAREKAEQAAKESARRVQEERSAAADQQPRKELIHERLDREAEEKKRVAALLRQVELVPIDEEAPVGADTAEVDAQPRARRSSSSRRRKSRSSRALRRSGGTHAGGGSGGSTSMPIAIAVMAIVIIIGLLAALLAN